MANQYLMGFDIGSSSVKATLLEVATGRNISSATSPKEEMKIIASQPGWAEQNPDTWWEHLGKATAEVLAHSKADPSEIGAIGISYQMHGLVLVGKDHQPLRPSIIWCDSRAVGIGQKAFETLGSDFCLGHYLNSPGNFTASKLKWVLDNEPETYAKIHKAMLPGDYIALKLTGEISSTVSGLSEGILWDFAEEKVAGELLKHYGIDAALLPALLPTFSVQGRLTFSAAKALGLAAGTPVSYRAGDQPNNAFSLNVLKAGEVAATAGTSGVVYGILETTAYDPASRVNTFVHVNHQPESPSYGVLLCINGTGIQNSWLKSQLAGLSYPEMNQLAATAPIGTGGLTLLPFGNGAERVLENRNLHGQILGLDFNRHTQAHLLRAAQEGIVYALNYGFNVMKGMGMELNTVRAGEANMFLSPLFREAFANVTGATIELYNTDGAQGAARGAGVGAGIYADFKEAFNGLATTGVTVPDAKLQPQYQDAYQHWLEVLNNAL